MKKFLLISFFLVIFFSVFFFKQEVVGFARQLIYFSYCDKPIKYRIGTVDPRFNITNNQLKIDTQEAAAIWNTIEGKELFAFDPLATLTINMTYDERQYLRKQIDQQGNSLTQEKASIEPKIGEFDKLAANFTKDLNDLNSQIQRWNDQGGAPPDAYNQLITKQQDLQRRSSELQQMAKQLKRSADAYNQEVATLNQTVDTFNDVLDVKPEEGLYDPNQNRIDIYFNVSKTELITTIAHELGHALNLEHDNNPKSIMYYKVTDILKPTASDMAAVHEQCKERNKLEAIYGQLVDRFNRLRIIFNNKTS